MNLDHLNETVYGTQDDVRGVMSEKVQSLAGTIYREFERMIARYDEDVVKTLMPLVVNVLECLDGAYQTIQEHEVELELLKEDNEQLVTQYEREKGQRKHSEQKLFELEDAVDGEKKANYERLESLENLVRILEIKHKNSLDQISRMEEREGDLKKEYAKLHDRYDELFKAHVETKERMKLIMNTSGTSSDRDQRPRLNPMTRSSGPVSFGFASLEGGMSIVEPSESMSNSPVSLSSSPQTPHNIDEEFSAFKIPDQTDTPQINQDKPIPASFVSRSQTRREQRSGNTLYQELSFQDNEADDASDITGMGKEVENLILENNELLATKNALNVVKDDLILKVDELTGEQEILRDQVAHLSVARKNLREQVSELEEEIKKLRDALNNPSILTEPTEEEADVPMAQRKRFTRVEMARVLLERNQYKEKYMELQDAVRYTEMVRASRSDTTSVDKKKSIWTLFSKLFSSSERPPRPLSTPHLRPSSHSSAMRHSRTQADFLETQLASEHHRRQDRNEQFRQVRAHVRKDDGRTHAYGWSLPSKSSNTVAAIEDGKQTGSPAHTSTATSYGAVPVPVFCRPVSELKPEMNLMCASGVDLTYNSRASFSKTDNTAGLSLAEEMASLVSPPKEEKPIQLENFCTQTNLSMMWLCCGTSDNALVMIVDANKAAAVVDSFKLLDKRIMCIAAAPGASSCRNNVHSTVYHDTGINSTMTTEGKSTSDSVTGDNEEEDPIGAVKLVNLSVVHNEVFESSREKATEAEEIDETAICIPSNQESTSDDVTQDPNNSSADGRPNLPHHSTPIKAKEEKYDSSKATMWMGTEKGFLYVHSALGNYSHCIARVKMPDAILSIAFCNLRCVVALANGTVAIFSRLFNGEWNFSKCTTIKLGAAICSVRCLVAVDSLTWCGCRNMLQVVDPVNLKIVHTLEAHPKKDSQVRQMAWFGDGVWVSIKMDSTLRLYHTRTYQHLMDVDIEPYVSKMLGTGKLGFSLVRISSLLISSGRLWIGTSNGVIISVPLSDHPPSGRSAEPDSSPVKSSVIPWCSMAHAQLSFHGHREAVTFFVSVPASPTPQGTPSNGMLVISGGEGYIDFRISDTEMEESVNLNDEGSANIRSERNLRSHLIVWQLAN